MAPVRIHAARPFAAWAAIIALSLASGTSADHQNLTAGVQVHHHVTPLGSMTFAKEPEGRGTWSIILSCTATFIFCVWTAMHPDIVPELSDWYRFFYRTLLMFIAAINPEAIAVVAWRQWRCAREIRKEWNAHTPKAKSRGEPTKEWPRMGMETAFFVVMGGFVIDRSVEMSNKYTEQKHKGKYHEKKLCGEAQGCDPREFIATVTPKGFLKYLSDGLFDDSDNPVFIKNDILDKSKSDYLGKFLSSFQALYLFVQCGARYQSGLTVTLLEIHVVIQVICTILILLCWSSKPMDVNEPIVISLKVKSAVPGSPRPSYDRARQRDAKDNPDELQPFQPIRKLAKDDLHALETTELGRSEFPLDHDYTVSRSPSGLSAVTNRVFFSIIAYLTEGGKLTTPPVKESSGTAKKGWWHALSLERSGVMLVEGVFIIIIAGLHALAWNFDFPTPVERLLWRLSCIGMALFPAAVILCAAKTSYHSDLAKVLWHCSMVRCNAVQYFSQSLIIIYELAEVNAINSAAKAAPPAEQEQKVTITTTANAMALEEGGKQARPRDIPGFGVFLHVCLLVLCILLLAGYLVSILFITVEGYISLRHLPDSAFLTVDWTDYLPHL